MFGLSPKLIITIVIIIVVIIVVICVVRGVKGFNERKGARRENREVDKELRNLIKDGSGPTISSAQAAMYADQLFTAMDGYGTDFPGISKVFVQVKNDADVLAISSAFGIREISSGQWNPEPNLKGTLAQGLTNELDEPQKLALAKLFADKGIKYNI